MRRGAALGLVALAAASGCGGARTTGTTTTIVHATVKRAASASLTVGVVGPLRVDVPGVAVRRGALSQVADATLVLADARSVAPAAVAEAARTHPASHYALVGASAAGNRTPNLVGVVLSVQDAAYLAGVVAGVAAEDQGGASPRVAWVGPEERALAAAFGRGVHDTLPDASVLHQWSRSVPARCKEAALTGLGRGAVVVMAHRGLCADAAAAAAHQQNLPALRLSDFLLPSVAAARVAREAAGGVFHGGEDLVFGPDTGAVGIRRLDPRIPIDTATRARAAAQELARGVGSGG